MSAALKLPCAIAPPAPDYPPEPDAADYASLSEAAKLLGKSERQLRRLCKEELVRRHGAVFAKPDKGKPQWFISRAYDRRLQQGIDLFPSAAPDLSRYTDQQRKLAFKRAEAVREYRMWRARETRPAAEWIGTCIAVLNSKYPALKISARSLQRWHSTYHCPADVEKLIDQRGGDQRSQGDPAAWNLFAKLFLQQSRPSMKTCWRQVRAHAQRGEFTWCSYVSCRRQLDKRIPKEVQTHHRQPKKWRQTQAPTGEFDPESWAAGACWESDHKQLDFYCRVERGGKISLVRPWLTAFKDWRTRRVVGHCLNLGPSSDTILAAFRMAMLDEDNFGGADEVHVDNGKDYDAYMYDGKSKSQRLKKNAFKIEADEPTFKGIFGLLNIDIHFSLPYNPNGKSRTERWFGILRRFSEQYASYVGRSVDTRPEELRRVEANPMLAPTFEDVQKELDAWIKAWNASADHDVDDLHEAGVKLSPDEAMQRWRGTDHVKVYDRNALELCLQKWAKPVTVGRNGVRFAPYGGKSWSYGKFAPELIHYKGTGKKLHISFDPADLSQIKVWDENLKLVGTLHRDERGAKGNREQVKQLQRNKRERAKALQVVRDTHLQEFLTDAELMSIENANDTRPTLPARDQSPALKLIQTGLERTSTPAQKTPTPKPGLISNERLSKGAAAMARNKEDENDHIDILDLKINYDANERDDDEDDFDLLGGSIGGVA